MGLILIQGRIESKPTDQYVNIRHASKIVVSAHQLLSKFLAKVSIKNELYA